MHDMHAETATPRSAKHSPYTALARRLRGESSIERPLSASYTPRELELSPLALRLQAAAREDQYVEPTPPSRSGVYALGVDEAVQKRRASVA